MKKTIHVLACMLLATSTFAQTVFTGSQEFDKQKKEGLYVAIPADKKNVEKEWVAVLGSFGVVTSAKGNHVISSANMPKISSSPINLLSKVTDNGSLISKFKDNPAQSTVFVAFDLGGGSFLNASNEKYAEAEKLLKDFYTAAVYNEELRVLERNLGDAQKVQEKSIKSGEKLAKDFEGNKKDKEKLLKKIEENKTEYDQLLKDIETNKVEQNTAKLGTEEKQKLFEAAKTRGLPKN